jgi:hypothetical protein
MLKHFKYIILSFLIVLLATSRLSAQRTSIFDVNRMSFNKENFSEMSPVILKDGIIFCSDRRFSTFSDLTSNDGRRLYNLYLTQKSDSSKWSAPSILKSSLSSRFNNSTLSIAPDGKTVYFTSDIEQGINSRKKSTINHNGIFIADMTGTELQNIRPFKYNNPSYDVAHPSVSRDGKYLFFASDMPGGQGKSDIWYCELIKGEWSAPVNPGPKVNSPDRELYPYMHASGKLYYSSDRPNGIGNLDIYSTSLYYGKWDDPVNLSEPINSTADDFAFVADENLQTGYFATKRAGSDDIFRFTSTIIRKALCDSIAENNYCYRFFEENAVKFDTLPFRYVWKFGDGTKAEGVMVEHCFNGPGVYVVQLDIENLITKEILHNEKNDTLNLVEVEQPFITSPDTINVGQQIKLSGSKTYLPGWKIARYYWNFGDESVDEGPEVGKIFTRPGNYGVQLIVTSEAGPDGTTKEGCVYKNINVKQQP